MRFFNTLTFTASLLLALLVSNAGCERRSEPVRTETYRLDILGDTYEWQGHLPKHARTSASWHALLQKTYSVGEELGAALDDIASQLSDDDYTRLKVIRDFAARIPLIDDEHTYVPYYIARTDGWNTRSRAVFIAAILRRQGYAAVPLKAGRRGLVGLAVDDPALNAHRVMFTVESFKFFSKEEIHQTFILWDPDHPIGRPGLPDDAAVKLLIDARDLLSLSDLQLFDFRTRNIPDSLYRRVHTRTFEIPGLASVSYRLYPDVAAWLEAYPELGFTAQLALDREESHRIRLTPPRNETPEATFISALLQGVQQHFAYVEGPLRSAHEILATRQGDCDQLALILGLMLLDAGYEPDDLVAIIWDEADHMGLGIRPQTADGAPVDGMSYTINGSPYYVLDPTYYHWQGELLVSAWGQMTPDNNYLVPTIEFLENHP